MSRRKSEKPRDGDMLPIRNSTAEFLTFVRDNGSDTIAVRFQDEMLWLTLPLIGALFDVAKSTVSEHLTNIFASGELKESSTVRKYRTVRQEGARQVERDLEYYNLEAIIAVGYRVNSVRAYLDLAERQAKKHVPMTMAAWAKPLDRIIVATGDELLTRASEISMEIAQEKAETEFDKFRVRQDIGYKSDFDLQLDWIEEQAKRDSGRTENDVGKE